MDLEIILYTLCESYDQSVFEKVFSLSFSHSSSIYIWLIFTPVLKVRFLGHRGCRGTCKKWLFFSLSSKRSILRCFLSLNFCFLLVCIDLGWHKWSKEHPQHATYILFWVSGKHVLAAKMTWELWFSWGPGTASLSLKIWKDLFCLRWGPSLCSLFLFTHGGRQLYQWNLSLNHRVLEHMKLECGNCYCLQ